MFVSMSEQAWFSTESRIKRKTLRTMVRPESAGLFAAVLGQHCHADDVVNAGRYRRLGDASQSAVHKHGLADSELVDECVELRTVAKLALGVLQRPRHAVTGQVGVAERGTNVTCQHLERCRLTGTVDTQQPETLALHN